MPEHPAPGLTLLAHFSAFYEEVALLKHAHAQGTLARTLAGPDGVAPANDAELAQALSARLAVVLEEQCRVERRAGGDCGGAFGMAQYAMTALADEVFILELDWPGSAFWLPVLLERRRFRSHAAGQRFFEQAGGLVEKPGGAAQQADQAAIFLLALRLGFKGRYRAGDPQGQLPRLRHSLYQLVRQGGAGRAPQENPARAFPHTYESVIAQGGDVRLAPLASWYALGKKALAAYLVLSLLVWLAVLYLPPGVGG